MERLGRDRDDHVDADQDDRGGHRRDPRRPGRVLGLLVHGDEAVPAPVDEHGDEHAGDERARRADVERVQPAARDVHRIRRRVGSIDLDQRHCGEDRECDDLRREQVPLQAGGELDPDPTDDRHHRDPDHADEGHPERAGCRAVGAEEQERVEAGDLREVRHHDDVGDDDRPPADPAGDWAERPRRPGEGRAAVGIDLVHAVVRGRHEQHRDEGDPHDRRRLEADGRHDQAERRRQAVARGGRRDADHHAGHEPQRARLQAFVARLGTVGGNGGSNRLLGHQLLLSVAVDLVVRAPQS